jgi:hypothetical protein
MLGDELANLFLGGMSLAGDARNLEVCSCWRDMRIES